MAESIASNKWYILFSYYLFYWGAICVALRGVGIFSQVSKWCGIIGTIIPAIILVILGFSYLWFSGKPAVIPLGWGDLFPNIANFQNIVLAASIFLAYAGMEMNAVHVNDLDNPTKIPNCNYHRFYRYYCNIPAQYFRGRLYYSYR